MKIKKINNNKRRGKYKIPFYSTKTNPNMLIDKLKELKSISNTMLYLRISFP